jgi:hypothetical protein
MFLMRATAETNVVVTAAGVSHNAGRNKRSLLRCSCKVRIMYGRCRPCRDLERISKRQDDGRREGARLAAWTAAQHRP